MEGLKDRTSLAMEGLFVGQNESSDGRFVCRTERV